MNYGNDFTNHEKTVTTFWKVPHIRKTLPSLYLVSKYKTFRILEPTKFFENLTLLVSSKISDNFATIQQTVIKIQ